MEKFLKTCYDWCVLVYILKVKWLFSCRNNYSIVTHIYAWGHMLPEKILKIWCSLVYIWSDCVLKNCLKIDIFWIKKIIIIATRLLWGWLYCRALTKRSIFKMSFFCISHISLSFSILCKKILAENCLQSSFFGSIKTLYPIFRVGFDNQNTLSNVRLYNT